MPWDQRKNGRRYYYRVRRQGDRVIKEYVGCGQVGEAAAEEDAERRAARQDDRLRRQEHEALNDQLRAVHDEATAIVEAALLRAGFRRHCRGRWRKRNVDKDEG
jgi:hypothetical protein